MAAALHDLSVIHHHDPIRSLSKPYRILLAKDGAFLYNGSFPQPFPIPRPWPFPFRISGYPALYR